MKFKIRSKETYALMGVIGFSCMAFLLIFRPAQPIQIGEKKVQASAPNPVLATCAVARPDDPISSGIVNLATGLIQVDIEALGLTFTVQDCAKADRTSYGMPLGVMHNLDMRILKPSNSAYVLRTSKGDRNYFLRNGIFRTLPNNMTQIKQVSTTELELQSFDGGSSIMFRQLPGTSEYLAYDFIIWGGTHETRQPLQRTTLELAGRKLLAARMVSGAETETVTFAYDNEKMISFRTIPIGDEAPQIANISWFNHLLGGISAKGPQDDFVNVSFLYGTYDLIYRVTGPYETKTILRLQDLLHVAEVATFRPDDNKYSDIVFYGFWVRGGDFRVTNASARSLWGHESSYIFNGLNPTQITGIDGRKTTFTYDAEGVVTSVVNEAGEGSSYEYSASNGLISKVNVLPSNRVAYQVDEWSSAGGFPYAGLISDSSGLQTRVERNTWGAIKRKQSSDVEMKETREANGNGGFFVNSYFNNVLQSRVQFDSQGKVLTEERPGYKAPTRYTYTSRGQVKDVTLPDGRVTTYAYAKGLLSQVNDSNSPYYTKYAGNNWGQMTEYATYSKGGGQMLMQKKFIEIGEQKATAQTTGAALSGGKVTRNGRGDVTGVSDATAASKGKSDCTGSNMVGDKLGDLSANNIPSTKLAHGGVNRGGSTTSGSEQTQLQLQQTLDQTQLQTQLQLQQTQSQTQLQNQVQTQDPQVQTQLQLQAQIPSLQIPILVVPLVQNQTQLQMNQVPVLQGQEQLQEQVPVLQVQAQVPVLQAQAQEQVPVLQAQAQVPVLQGQVPVIQNQVPVIPEQLQNQVPPPQPEMLQIPQAPEPEPGCPCTFNCSPEVVGNPPGSPVNNSRCSSINGSEIYTKCVEAGQNNQAQGGQPWTVTIPCPPPVDPNPQQPPVQPLPQVVNPEEGDCTDEDADGIDDRYQTICVAQ